MFKQVFEIMNEVLDEIIVAYPTAVGVEKEQLTEHLNALKTMSDTFIEEWLQFEEKMSNLHSKPFVQKKKVEPMIIETETYDKAQGYFKLMMFEHAIQQFKEVIHHQPDFYMARLYLALCYCQMGEQDEAYHHFLLITSLTEDAKIKAVCYHNMGWIQAQMQNMDKATEYFEKAYETDPSVSFYSLS